MTARRGEASTSDGEAEETRKAEEVKGRKQRDADVKEGWRERVEAREERRRCGGRLANASRTRQKLVHIPPVGTGLTTINLFLLDQADLRTECIVRSEWGRAVPTALRAKERYRLGVVGGEDGSETVRGEPAASWRPQSSERS